MNEDLKREMTRLGVEVISSMTVSEFETASAYDLRLVETVRLTCTELFFESRNFSYTTRVWVDRIGISQRTLAVSILLLENSSLGYCADGICCVITNLFDIDL